MPSVVDLTGLVVAPSEAQVAPRCERHHPERPREGQGK